jgi:hypothetical protein
VVLGEKSEEKDYLKCNQMAFEKGRNKTKFLIV